MINEAAFAFGEGVGYGRGHRPGDGLGAEPPRCRGAWADEIGLDHVWGVLNALCEEYREKLDRRAPALRRLAATGAPRGGSHRRRAFFEYAGSEGISRFSGRVCVNGQ